MRVPKRGAAAGAIGAAVITGQAGQRSHAPEASDLPDSLVAGVTDIDVPGAVHGHPLRLIKLGAVASAIVAAEVVGGTGERSDHPSRGDLPNCMVPGISYIDQGAGAVNGNALGLVEPRTAAGSIGPARVADGAGEGGDHSGRSDLSYGIIDRKNVV